LINEASVSTTSINGEQKTRISKLCSDCFTLILNLKNADEYGDPDVLRQRVIDLLSAVEQKAKKYRIDFEDIRKTIFALVAFLDETIIASEWSKKDAWLSNPLQLEYFNRYDAGVEFFANLEHLRQRPQHNWMVIEVYYLCMTLGFKGKYREEGRDILQQLIEKTYADLRMVRGSPSEIISPHGKRKEDWGEMLAKEVPVWVVGISAITIAFLTYILFNMFISNYATEVANKLKPALVKSALILFRTI